MKKLLSIFVAIMFLATIGTTAIIAEEALVWDIPATATLVNANDAAPDTEGMYTYNVKYKTLNVRVETKCKYDENTITYIIRKIPVGTETGDGVIIDTVNADGFNDLPRAMKEWSKFNKVNVFWMYNNGPVENGHFNTPCTVIIN